MKKTFFQKVKFMCLTLLVCCFYSGTVLAQPLKISGEVLDSDNEAAIGATVTVKGTNNGTITDVDGKFVLSNVQQNSVLQITYLGHKTEEIPVNGRSYFSVTLNVDQNVLDEFIVVGYGVQRKSDLTGAVGSVKASDVIKSTPIADISTALQGRLAGMSVVSSSGAPNGGATIRIRGTGSFLADQAPLVVVDGIIGGALSAINPSDIESIEILKDASATAVYGSRGAPGVILITTKTPKRGKVSLTYNTYINFKTPYELPSMLSPGEYARLANAYKEEFEGAAPMYTDEEISAFDNGAGYDYMDAIFKDVAIEHTHEISISGGGDKTNFLFSGSYTNNQGTARESKMERYNYRLKVDTEIKSWLKTGFNFWGNYTKSTGPRFADYKGVFLTALNFPNTQQPKDASGNFIHNNLVTGESNLNPLMYLSKIDNDGYNYTSRLQGYFDVKFMDGLNYRMVQSFRFENVPNLNTYAKDSYEYYNTYNQQEFATFASSHNYSWVNTNTLSYIKEFNKDHRVNATAVFEQMFDDTMYNRTEAVGLSSSIIGANNTAMGSTQKASSNREKVAMMSWLGRVNYVFKNRYMLTASYRRDGSSRLAKGHQWDSFYSYSLAWNLMEESFMKNFTDLSQLKLRFGYGETGNQAVPNYSAFSRYGTTLYGDDILLQATQLGNKVIGWEKNKQYNYGIDMGFFNNRLTATIDIYNKRSEDVLLYVNSPYYTGFSSRLENAAVISNKGIEITIGSDPIVLKDFNWNTNITLTHNKAKLVSVPGDLDYVTLSSYSDYFRNIVGQKIATMYGYVCEGVWTTSEVEAGLAPTGVVAGSYKYKDFDGIEGISADDRTIIGNGQPSFEWGWNNSFNYKNFDMSVFVVGFHGFDIYNYTRQARLGTGNGITLGPNPEWLRRWQAGVNENTDVAGFVQGRNSLTASSQFVEKGDFVKVKSITLGYTLPQSLLKKADIEKLRFYVSFQNPFLFTSYSGTDPEVCLRTPLTSGIDWAYYPNGRNYLIGMNLTF